MILTGEAGCYIDAVCNGIDDIPSVDPGVRDKMRRNSWKEGIGLYPHPAAGRWIRNITQKVDLNNQKRILKAPVWETSGRPCPGFSPGKPKDRPFRIVKIGLDLPRAVLHGRINLRVLRMMEEGLEK